MQSRSPNGATSTQSASFLSRTRRMLVACGAVLLSTLLFVFASQGQGAEEKAKREPTDAAESEGDSPDELQNKSQNDQKPSPSPVREGSVLEERSEAVEKSSEGKSAAQAAEKKPLPATLPLEGAAVGREVVESGATSTNAPSQQQLVPGVRRSSGASAGEMSKPKSAMEGPNDQPVNELLDQLDEEATQATKEATNQLEGEPVAAEGEAVNVPLPEKSGEEESGSILPDLEAAGTAGITGEVFGPTGEGLPGVVVSIPVLNRTTRADREGNFEFVELPAGELTLKFNKLGYKVAEREVLLKKGGIVEVSQALEEQPVEYDDGEYEMDEVDVVGEYIEEEKTDTEVVIDLGDFESGGIVSGITAEDFAKSDASDAADAVATVAGANIVDGKFAVVRGLADRYVSTTYNGGAIASSVPDRKAVELDLFPTSALVGINVEKTYSPLLSGDFGGAAIDIRTKSFPAESFIKVQTEFGFVPELPSNFLTVSDTDLGFLGDVGLTFDLDGVLNENGAFIGSSSNAADQQLAQAVGRELFIESRSLFPDQVDPENPSSYGLSIGKNFKPTEQFEWGVLFNLNQGSFDNFNEATRIRPVDVAAPQNDFVRQFSRNREWDMYLATGFKAFEQHEVGVSFFRKHVATLDVAEATQLRSFQDSEGFGLVQGAQEQDGQLQRIRDSFGAYAELTGSSFTQQAIERDLDVFQLLGKHQFGERGPKVDWSFTDSNAREFRENSFLSFGVLDFGSEALLNEIDGIALDSVNGVVEDITNPTFFVGVEVPEFENAGEAIAGIGQIIDGLTVDNLSPDAPFPPQFSREQILSRLQSIARRDLANSAELLAGLDPERADELTFSIRTLSVEPGQGVPIIRGLQTVNEQIQNLRTDVALPFYFSKENEKRGFELLLGGAQTQAERSTVGLAAQLLLETTDGALELTPGSLTVEQLAQLSSALETGGEQGFNEALAGFITGGSSQAAQVLDASTGPLDTIFANRIASNSFTTRDIESHYFGARFFWDEWFLRGGLRFESEQRDGEILDPQPNTGVDFPGFSASEILPSLSFGTSLFDKKLTLFGSWSQTVARPTFFEFVPIVSQDFASNTIRQGNANLNNTDITNFDLSAALTFGEQSLFRASLFHKLLQEPIVARRQPEFPNAITFVNGESGSISGLELELNFLDFKPWTLNANVTFIDASLRFDGGLGSGGTIETSFPFQPRLISNINLGYESVDNDWGVNLVFNYTGEQNTLLPATLENVTQQQRPLLSLDLLARKTFDWEGLGLFRMTVGIKNLIANDREEIFVGGDANAFPLVGQSALTEQRLRTFFVGGQLEF